MSICAKSWAYEQRCGKVRESGKYAGSYKGDPTAKAVLVAVAEFANAKGECWPGQLTLADMCDMDERTVRAKLAHLEDELKLIERTERRRRDGTRTSDSLRLLAPTHRLRPPAENPSSEAQAETGEESQPENHSGDSWLTGKVMQVERKSNAGQPEAFSAQCRDEPSVEPSDELSAAAGEGTPLSDNVTASCLLLLNKVEEFPRDRTKVALMLADLHEQFPLADPVKVSRDYEWKHRNGMKTRNHLNRLRAFFEQGQKRAEEDRRHLTTIRPHHSDGAGGNPSRYTEGYEFLFEVRG